MNEYAKELGEVLKTFNVSEMRRFIINHWEMYTMRGIDVSNCLDDKWLKGCMAKMILARTDMPYELKEQAMKVLDELKWDYTTY